MNTLRIAAASIAVLLSTITIAEARHSHHYRHHYSNQYQYQRTDRLPTVAYYGDGNIEYDSGHVVSHPSGCPGRAFCGCGVCVKLGIPAATCKKMGLFLASAWGHKFPAASPGPGMVAVRNHHVMLIVAYSGGAATVYDPNSGGHATRVHTRSLAGYRIVNPHGSRMATL